VKFDPHPYQDRGIRLMLEEPAAAMLADMGLGKTVISLTAADVMIKAGEVQYVLVVAPLRVVHTVWEQEAQKWDHLRHLRFSVVHGTPAQRKNAFGVDADIYLTNFDNLKWLTEQPEAVEFDMLIIDESTELKNHKTKRFKALRKILPHFKRRYILTGTPAPNGYEDLWAQYYLLDLGERLGPYITHYRMEYFYPAGFGWKLQDNAEHLINKKIADISLRLAARDYLKMPPLIHTRVPIELPAKARKAYHSLSELFFAQLDDGVITVANAAVKTTKLRQLSNGSIYHDDGSTEVVHTNKLDALEEIYESLQGNPLLVAYEFDHDRLAIQKRFGCTSLKEHTTKKQQQEVIRAWNAGELQMLALHPKAGGHGLNLQHGGHHLAWYGLTWNLNYYDQLIARLWRQGQKQRVFVYHLLAENTLDDVVLKTLRAKNRTQQGLLQALAELGTQ
jgi:SNF2 family DNA or RNA helicase